MKINHLLRPALLAGLLLAFASGCATTDFVTGKKTQNIYSLKDDVDLGQEFYKETMDELNKEKEPIDKEPARVALVRKVTANIAAVANITNLPYEVTYVGDPEIVNAYAFPGGHVMVFEGLWDEKEGLVQTVDELAAVIGHEIAHVNCRHSTEEMTREMLPNLVLAGGLIWAEIENDDDLQMLFSGLMLVHDGLIVTKYSRVDELEADRIGMMYMAKAGYDPAAAPRVWERLSGNHDDQVEKVLSIFSTHPRDYKRVKELRKSLPEAQAIYAAVPHNKDGAKKISDLVPPLENKKVKKEAKKSKTAKDGTDDDSGS